MQRYVNKTIVKIGDRIIFDNSLGFINEIPKIKVIGDVISISTSKADNILVGFKINNSLNIVEAEIPYFLAQ